MTKLIRCQQGHVFDAERGTTCPTCGEQVVLKVSDAGNSAAQEIAPPPPPARRSLLIAGAVALCAAAAVAGGYFVFRTDVSLPEKPSASTSSMPSTTMPTTAAETPGSMPTTASPASSTSSTSGGETNSAPTEPSVAQQTPAPIQRSADGDNSNANREEKTALARSAPAPTLPPLAAVNSAIAGEWELSVSPGRWVLRIEPDGAYAFHAEPLSAAKPDSGVFSAEAGQWAMRTNNGFADGGSYSVTSGTFAAKGHRGLTTWHRVIGAPKSILGQMDPRIVGNWELPVSAMSWRNVDGRPGDVSGRWLWRINADGTWEFRSEANDGMKPSAGIISSMDGRWSLRSPNGYTDGGPYSFPTPDTFLATGHFGTGAWRRIP